MTEVSAPVSSADLAGGMTWRRLLRDMALAYGIVVVVGLAIAFAMGVGIEPFILVPAVLALVAGIWLSKGAGKAPVIFTLVVFLLTVFMTFWLIFGLFAYNSPIEFLISVAFVLFVVVGIGVAIAALRRPDTPGGERTRKVIGALAALAVVVAIVGVFTKNDEAAQSGDLRVVAKDFEFEPETLTASAGKVAFHLDNEDPFTHDIAVVKGTDTDADEIGKEVAAGNAGARLEVDLQSGAYTYFCSIHPDMKGALTVS